MSLRQLPTPKMQFFNSSGGILSGGKVYTYIAGTTTAKATYSDSAGSTPNANPIILDSRGEATIYWDGTYKVIVKDSNDVTIYTVDNHGGGSIEDVSSQRSLLLNYSFETDSVGDGEPDDWAVTLYTGGTQTLDTSAGNQIHGAKALKFTSTGSGGGYAESEFFLVHEGELVPATWATKSSVADVRNLVELVWYDRSQGALSTSSIYDDSTANPTTWTDKTGSATAPSNARFAKLRLTGCHSSDSTVGSTWYDDVRVSDAVRVTGTQTVAGDKTFSGSTTLGTAVVNSTGVMTAGTVPVNRVLRNSASGKASSVTVTSSATTIKTLDVGDVTSGDVIFVFWQVTGTKGGTAGDVTIFINKNTGAGTIFIAHDLADSAHRHNSVPISASFSACGTVIVRVNGTGSLTLQIQATSAGSDMTSATGQIYAMVLNGSG